VARAEADERAVVALQAAGADIGKLSADILRRLPPLRKSMAMASRGRLDQRVQAEGREDNPDDHRRE